MKPKQFASFEQVLDYMKTKSGKQRFNMGVGQRNTLLQVRDTGEGGEIQSVALRVHNTDVLTFTTEGVRLQTRGWSTVLTKRRMNQWGPARVYSHEHQWYVSNGVETVPFEENMWIDYSGAEIKEPVGAL